MENPEEPERGICRPEKKTLCLLGFILLAGVILFAGVLILSHAPNGTGKDATRVSIDVHPRNYSLWMSSVPGMGLTANVTGTSSPELEYRWDAGYGTFESWSASTGYRVIWHGDSVSNDGETVYWNFYTGTGTAIPTEPVTIRLSISDRKTGTLLGTSEIRVAVIDNVTATVLD